MWSPCERAATNQFTALFRIYNRRNKTVSVTVYHTITKIAYSDQLVSDCFVFPRGTDAFCLYHTAKKTLRVYGALVHIAPLFVCV